jgi:hypothetical protein
MPSSNVCTRGSNNLEAELARLVSAIAEGPSQTFMAAIGKRERQLQTITNKLHEPGPALCAPHLMSYETLRSRV